MGKSTTFNLEKKLKKQGYQIVIGVDEAGRGPLAGPVVACAVVLKCHPELVSGSDSNEMLKQVQHDKLWDLIKDSKKLSEKQRKILFDFIQENFYVGVGMCDHKTIDLVNILQASLLAMKKAVNNLLKANNFQFSIFNFQPASTKLQRGESNPNSQILNDKKFKNTKYPLRRVEDEASQIPDTKYIILIDGNKKISKLNLEQKTIIGGDRKVKSIAAASIVAKVIRDRLMFKMHRKYPHYGFNKHKGYGTKIHLQNLEKHGPSPIHRLSFRPIKQSQKN